MAGNERRKERVMKTVIVIMGILAMFGFLFGYYLGYRRHKLDMIDMFKSDRGNEG